MLLKVSFIEATKIIGQLFLESRKKLFEDRMIFTIGKKVEKSDYSLIKKTSNDFTIKNSKKKNNVR